MEWENKFSSIIGETEANLIRIKDKINNRKRDGISANRTYNEGLCSTNYCSPVKNASRSFDQYPIVSTPKNVQWVTDLTSKQDGASVYTLCNKIEKQNRTIEQLTNLVEVMEKERAEYKHQISELKYEVQKLSRNVSDKYADKHLEGQFRLLKKDISSEIQSIREQVQNYRTRIDGSQRVYEDQSYTRSGQSKDLHQVRQIMRDELEFVKTDLDVLRCRLGSLESQVLARTKDRNTTKLERVIDKLADNQRLISETRDILPDVINDKRSEKSEIEQLRLNVSALKEKLNSVEDKLCQSLNSSVSSSTSNIKPTWQTCNGRKKSYKERFVPTVNIEEDDFDEFLSNEDSDDLESDLDDLLDDSCAIFSSKREKNASRRKADLDLDGLNLSDREENLVNSDINSDDDLDSLTNGLQ